MMRTTLTIALFLAAPAVMAGDHGNAGDAERGAGKAAICAACHGPGGNSNNPEWPSLAGQHAKYTVAQLMAFKSGERKNAVMAAQVANLSDQDMHDLAAYYEAQEAKPGVANPETVDAAQKLFRGGRAEDGIAACSACHGPSGLGNAAAAYPRVSSQQAKYTAMQLRAYRDGSRAGTDAARMMSNVATKLTDADIEALASYLAGLH